MVCAPGTINQKSRRAEASLRKRKERIEGGTVCVGGKKALLLSHLPPYTTLGRRGRHNFHLSLFSWCGGGEDGGTAAR